MAGRSKKADASLIVALACGASAEQAAQKTGLSRRTVYRRLAEPTFRAQVDEVRADLVWRLAGMLTAAGMASVKTLTTLQDTAASEAVRLGAARAILEMGGKLRDAVEFRARLAALEAQLQAVLEIDGVSRTLG